MSKNFKTKNVAVLGMGLDGLFAARAAEELGHRVTVFAPDWDRGGLLWNANSLTDFWVSWVPEDIAHPIPRRVIKLIPEGTEAKYLKLRLGRVPVNATTFNSDFPARERQVFGYDPELVFKAMLPNKILDFPEKPSQEEIYSLTEDFDHVFQTFASEDSYSEQSELLPFYLAISHDTADPLKNKVWFNGTGLGYVALRAELWGDTYYEFPTNISMEEIQRVMPPEQIQLLRFSQRYKLSPFTRIYQPPMYTPSNLHFVGKFAEWNPYREPHQTYNCVKDILDET